MIIGICGKSGSGKSTLAKILLEKYNDAIYLDIDKIGHGVYRHEEVREKIRKYFGNEVVKEGQIDRKMLGSIVFDDEDEMSVLTDITWEYMEKDIDDIMSKNFNKLIILDWALLVKTKYFDMCDFKILLDIPYEIRKNRAMKRDNITSEVFDLRDSASIDYDSNQFDYCLKDNNEDVVKRLVRLI